MSDTNKDNNFYQVESLLSKLGEKNAVNVTFDGWYTNNNSVIEAHNGDFITARICISGGRQGVYKFKIRREVSSSGDETIIETFINYEGNLLIKEQTFTAQINTEKNFHGYFIEVSRDSGDLLIDGSHKWLMSHLYPPRLKVI